MRLAFLVLVVIAAPAAAQSWIVQRHLPAFDLHRTTGNPIGWVGCKTDAAGTRCGVHHTGSLLRYRFDLVGSSQDRAGASAILGVRGRPDRYLQLRTGTIGNDRSLFGEHRARGRWGWGDLMAGGFAPAIDGDVAIRHGDTRWQVGLDGEGTLLDVDAAATASLRDLAPALDRPWWKLLGGVVPVTVRQRALTFMAADGRPRALTMRSVASGIGIESNEVYRTEGGMRLLHVTWGRVELDRPSLRKQAGVAQPQAMELVETRVLSIDDMVLVDDFDMVALWDLGLGMTWLRDETGDEVAAFTGRMGLVCRVWEYGTFGAAIGQQVRPADTADAMVKDFGIDVRADTAVRRIGVALRVAANRTTRLFEPAAQPTWRSTLHGAWHVRLGVLDLGIEHAVQRDAAWAHYAGLFVRASLRSRDAAILD